MNYSWRAFKNISKQKLKQGPFRLREDKDKGVLLPPVNDVVACPMILPSFLSKEECENIVQFSNALKFSDSIIRTDEKGGDIRKSDVSWIFPSSETNWVFDYIESAIREANKRYKFELFGFFEGSQIAKYGEEGHYGWHSDVGSGRASSRKLSISILLSSPDDYDGGALEFMSAGANDPKTQGTAIIFPSFLEHRVAPVKSGLRISLVSWISGPPFRLDAIFELRLKIFITLFVRLSPVKNMKA